MDRLDWTFLLIGIVLLAISYKLLVVYGLILLLIAVVLFMIGERPKKSDPRISKGYSESLIRSAHERLKKRQLLSSEENIS